MIMSNNSIRLNKKKGYLHAIAFIYTPKGQLILNGDIDAIQAYMIDNNYPICYGWLRITPNKEMRVRLFGVDSDRYYIDRINRPSLRHEPFEKEFYKNINKRANFAFRSRSFYAKDACIIKTWRRLPKTYINFDKIIALKG